MERNRQLEEKKKELERLNFLLDDYNRNLEEIVRERELLQSKARIHDEMNVLIISTMNALRHYDVRESERLIALWNSSVLALEQDTEPYRKNPLQTLHALAKSLGIALSFSGQMPTENERVRLIIAAVSECMTNAIRHADATTVFVEANQNGVRITNDGNPPKESITEGGGLSNLRARVQALQADMQLQSAPKFELTIRFC